MKLKVIVEPSEEGGYTAFVPSIPGCIGEGVTREEALSNIGRVFRHYLELIESDILMPQSEVVEIAI